MCRIVKMLYSRSVDNRIAYPAVAIHDSGVGGMIMKHLRYHQACVRDVGLLVVFVPTTAIDLNASDLLLHSRCSLQLASSSVHLHHFRVACACGILTRNSRILFRKLYQYPLKGTLDYMFPCDMKTLKTLSQSSH